MLTKQAQEEVYNAYYNQGVELALGQVKVAGKTKEVIKKMIQVPSAALGGMGSLGVVYSLPESVRQALLDGEHINLISSALGLGGAAGYAASGKVVDGLASAASAIDNYRKNKKIFESIPGLKFLRDANLKRKK